MGSVCVWIVCGKTQPECLETNNPINENHRGWANGYAWLVDPVEDDGQLEKVIDYSRPRYYFLMEERTHDILEKSTSQTSDQTFENRKEWNKT